MKMSRNEGLLFFAKINAVLNSETKLTFDMIYAISKVKNKIKNIIEEINEFISQLQKEERKLSLEFCEKDESGKPVIRDDRYCGLEEGLNPEYDAKIADLMVKKKAYLKEEIEINMHYINKEEIPKNGPAHILGTLFYFVKDENGK